MSCTSDGSGSHGSPHPDGRWTLWCRSGGSRGITPGGERPRSCRIDPVDADGSLSSCRISERSGRRRSSSACPLPGSFHLVHAGSGRRSDSIGVWQSVLRGHRGLSSAGRRSANGRLRQRLVILFLGSLFFLNGGSLLCRARRRFRQRRLGGAYRRRGGCGGCRFRCEGRGRSNRGLARCVSSKQACL